MTTILITIVLSKTHVCVQPEKIFREKNIFSINFLEGLHDTIRAAFLVSLVLGESH